MEEKTGMRRRIAAGETISGTMALEFLVPGLPAMVDAAGADFLLLDMEHTGAGFETMKMLCAACRKLDVVPVVRVPAAEYSFVARALDIGAHGVMVPMVDTPEQAELIARSAHYPPAGRRGAAFGLAHDDYLPGDPARKMAAADARTFVIAQIESATGLANVGEIAAVDGIDVVWVGHFDLSNFMGIPGEFDHPDFDAALIRIAQAARAAGKAAGIMAGDRAWAARAQAAGYTVFAHGVDHLIYQQAIRATLNAFRSGEPAV